MSRRQVLFVLGAAALATALPSFAQQQGKVWRMGFLWDSQESYLRPRFEAFKAGMRELGYVEGRDFVIEQRSAEIDLARLPGLAAELITLKVDLIVAPSTTSGMAAHNVTRDIPILIVTASDPVGSGLAASLARPGGNVTGLTGINTDLSTKRLDLLRQIVPGMRRAGFVYNPDNAGDVLSLKQFESDCAKLGFQSIRAPLRKVHDIASTFNSLKRGKSQGLVVANSSTNNAWRASLIEHASKHQLPAIYAASYYPEAGGLISYSVNAPDLFRRAAAYAVKIFKGARPGDLPIEQPLNFETVINLKTAKALGIKIPDTVLLRADKVIE